MQQEQLNFLSIWLSAGFSFWLYALWVNGVPKVWRSRKTNKGWVTGWRATLMGYLPLCIVIGPVAWMLYWGLKLYERPRRRAR